MDKVPIICSDQELNSKIEEKFAGLEAGFEPVFLDNAGEAVEFMKYELPEITIVRAPDPSIEVIRVFDEVRNDPWLHFGGILVISENENDQALAEMVENTNIISVLPLRFFDMSFSGVMNILRENRQILFQRDLRDVLLTSISGSFVMDNDPLNARTYSNLVTNYLFNANYIDRDTSDRLHVALLELMMNAIEHGNCKITYEEKTRWMEAGGDMIDLIKQKCEDPVTEAKRVHFSYDIRPEGSRFVIRDEGSGFDWRKRVSPENNEVNLHLHGHGIKMANFYMNNLSYNEKGNEVSFEIAHQQNQSNILPAVFAGQARKTFHDKEYVFREGEESNFLYYIVSGSLKIYAGGKLVSKLTPDDIFLGEMSFLLSNRRTASVISEGTSVLIQISKNDFINAVKEHPYYGIFLARLLARRLSRLNALVGKAKRTGRGQAAT